jgi:hypothetical protein
MQLDSAHDVPAHQARQQQITGGAELVVMESKRLLLTQKIGLRRTEFL